jgi:hypothetical protein
MNFTASPGELRRPGRISRLRVAWDAALNRFYGVCDRHRGALDAPEVRAALQKAREWEYRFHQATGTPTRWSLADKPAESV